MKKRLFAGLLALALCFGLLPGAALAYDYHKPEITELHIGTTKIEEDTYYTVKDGTIEKEGTSGNYNIYYQGNKLTLNNVELTSAIYVPGGTTVELRGENSSGSEEDKVSIGIQAITAGDITITGTGSYDVYTNYEGIATVYANQGDIMIRGGRLHMHGASISTRYGGITISGQADVTVGTLSTGGDPHTEEAQRADNIVIEGSAKVTAECISNLQTIMMKENAEVTVENPSGTAISGNRGIEISGNAQVNAIGTTGGLNAFAGPITINSTQKTVAKATDTTRTYAAISMGQSSDGRYPLTINSNVEVSGAVGIGSSQGTITIDGGTLTTDVTYAGIINSTSAQDCDINFKDANVIVKGTGTAGIHAPNGTVRIENSTVTVQATSYAYSAMPSLNYPVSYKVTAGEDSESAVVIPNGDLKVDSFQNKYVKIEPLAMILVESVTLNQTELSLTPGETSALTATVAPDNATDWTVTWASSDVNVATVDETGTVTAVAPGTAIITVTANDGNGKSASCEVTVAYPYVPPIINPSYGVTVAPTANGTVTVSPAAAQQGQTVTVTAVPSEGYELSALTVTDRFGNTVMTQANPNGTYSFVMPGSQVTVSAVFVEKAPDIWVNPFGDVAANDWFYSYVEYACRNGLMNGTSAVTFDPSGTVTRGTLMTILARMDGVDTSAGSSWYQVGMEWAVAEGVSDGTAPEGLITREQVAAMLYRYAGSPAVAGEWLNGFADRENVSDWAVSAMNWAVSSGIITGGDKGLNPQGTATRAELAAMLTRFAAL